MHELILKYFAGELTPAERKELFATLRTREEWKKEFAEMQNMFAASAFACAPLDKNIAEKKLHSFNRQYRRRPFPLVLKRVASYAAVALISIGCTYWMMNGLLGPEESIVAYEEFSTPAGQRAQLKLHDGTVVWLNACSSLRYPNHFADDERKVELEGEAYFEVRKSKEKPFVVETSQADIKVMGTEFNVFAYPGKAEFTTSLVNGSVKVYAKNNEQNALTLAPHECAYFTDAGLEKKTYEEEDFLLWKQGIYSFSDLPFVEIAKKLELYYDITLIINNDHLKSFRYTGKFRQRDGVENVLRTLQKVYPFTYIKDDEKNCITLN